MFRVYGEFPAFDGADQAELSDERWGEGGACAPRRTGGPPGGCGADSTGDTTGAGMRWLIFRETYIERLRRRSPGSEHPENVRKVLDRFTVRRNLLAKTVDAVGMLDLEEYIRSRTTDTWRGQPLTRRTLNNEIGILNACLAWAGPRERGARGGGARLGIVDNPPFLDFLPEPEPPEPVALEAEQLRAFLAVAATAKTPAHAGISPGEFWAVAIVLGFVTALRRGSLLRVPRPDDRTLLEERILPVPATVMKTRNAMRIPLTPEVATMCSRLPSRPGSPLLPWRDARGRSMTPKHFTETIREMQRSAGVPDANRLRLKHLRSTTATLVCESESPETAKRRLAHSPTSTVLQTNYVKRRVTESDRRASAMLADVVLEQVRMAGIPLSSG